MSIFLHQTTRAINCKSPRTFWTLKLASVCTSEYSWSVCLQPTYTLSVQVVTRDSPLTLVRNCSGMGNSANSPSGLGTITFISEDLAVTISVLRDSLLRNTWHPSVFSMEMVGMHPMTCNTEITLTALLQYTDSHYSNTHYHIWVYNLFK